MIISAIYIAAAVLPALYLMRVIYNLDTFEKEPPALLRACVVRGVYAAFLAIVLEIAGQFLMGLARITPNSPLYVMVLAFGVVAVAEEGAKFFFLHRLTWNDPNFNYRFDGIVYSAFVSLGFAAFENIKYVFNYGLSVAGPRAVLSIPGHLGFAIAFGYFYGRARVAANQGYSVRARNNLIAGYLAAVLLHGFYDTCAMTGTPTSTTVFLVFVIIMYIVIIRLVRKEARTNMQIR